MHELDTFLYIYNYFSDGNNYSKTLPPCIQYTQIYEKSTNKTTIIRKRWFCNYEECDTHI